MNYRELQVKRFLSSLASLEVQSKQQEIQARGNLLHSDLRLYINTGIYIPDLFFIHMTHCIFFQSTVALLNTLARIYGIHTCLKFKYICVYI